MAVSWRCAAHGSTCKQRNLQDDVCQKRVELLNHVAIQCHHVAVLQHELARADGVGQQLRTRAADASAGFAFELRTHRSPT
jgi:hypothetical protein